jgi:aminopeptidase N
MQVKLLSLILFLLSGASTLLISSPNRQYDVLKYKIAVDWVAILPSTNANPELRRWNGSVGITLVCLSDAFSEVELDCAGLEVQSVSVNDMNCSDFLLDGTRNVLNIPLHTSVHKNDTITLYIDYIYSYPYNIGFMHRNTKTAYPDSLTEHPFAGTLCEPSDTKYWLPCNDVPNDKALVNLSCAVPLGYKAISNGVLDSVVIDTFETYFWSCDAPIAPYLVCIEASDYVVRTDRVPKRTGSNDSVTCYYYCWADDWDGPTYSMKKAVSSTAIAMSTFGDVLFDYPFAQYGIVECQFGLVGASGTGMEHQSITSVAKNWLKRTLPAPEFTSFAHELGHNWFGNYVTCNSWSDVWFNEGGASWLEAIYSEHYYNDTSLSRYYSQMQNFRTTYIKYTHEHPELMNIVMTDLNEEELWTNSGSVLIYDKASWIFHQLRELLGDEICMNMLRELLHVHKFGTLSSEEFVLYVQNYVSNVPFDIDISKFVSQWLFFAGHPIYNITCAQVTNPNGTFTYTTTLSQVQSGTNILPNYEMLLTLNYYDNNGLIVNSQRQRNYERVQQYELTTPDNYAYVYIDTTTALLEMTYAHITSINERPSYISNTEVQLSNTLVKRGSSIEIISNTEVWNCCAVDISGRTIELDISNGSINTSHLPIGLLFISVNNQFVSKIIIY